MSEIKIILPDLDGLLKNRYQSLMHRNEKEMIAYLSSRNPLKPMLPKNLPLEELWYQSSYSTIANDPKWPTVKDVLEAADDNI